jgi:dipeptidyl aminopeptidase/acylaminoacyl peptidase
VPPDTILVLRDAGTLDPADTLAFGTDGRIRLPVDTSRALRSPGGPSVPDRLRTLPVDSLRTLSPDSLQSVLRRLRLLPDTTLVPVAPDTAATPDGDLLQMRRWLDQNRQRSDVQVFTRLDPRGEDGLNPTSTYRHYFLVGVPDGIRSGDPPRPPARPVTRGYRSYYGADWMPGGSQVVVSAPPQTTEAPTRLRDRNLYVVDLRPYRVNQLLDLDGYTLSRPRVTADGTTLAFRAQDRSTRSYAHAEIGLFELDGRSNPQIITAGFDHDVSSLRWSPDGWYLYATAPTSVGRPLYRFAPFARGDTSTARRRTSLADDYTTSRDTFALDSSMVRTAAVSQVLDETRTVQAYDVTDSKAVYAVAGPQNPSELYTNTISFNNEQRLTAHNAGWVADRSLASTERFVVQSAQVAVEGRLTRPVPLVDSLRYPLVVVPRGGPSALQPASPILPWFERHLLAGRGYAVLEVWPRGSDGYGETFRRRNFQDWGPGPAADVLAATDSVLSRAWVDSTRQVIAGRAYGGYLTAWLVGQTDRFRAAVAGSGVYDLSSFFGDGEVWPIIPEQFGGFPWETTASPPPDLFVRPRPSPLLSVGLIPSTDTTMAPRVALRRNSPMAQAHRIDTPLLLTHGGADHRTGPTQAEMFYRRLHILDRPVEYVRYPGVGHDVWRSAPPRQRVDRLARLYEFLARYAAPGGHRPTGPGPAP